MGRMDYALGPTAWLLQPATGGCLHKILCATTDSTLPQYKDCYDGVYGGNGRGGVSVCITHALPMKPCKTNGVFWHTIRTEVCTQTPHQTFEVEKKLIGNLQGVHL